MGVVYQSFQLLPMLTLVQNVMLPMDMSGLFHPRKSKERALELLDQVDLSEHVNKFPTQISGGQQQRVAIARALVNNPHIILADEPTGNLDTATGGEIMDLLVTLNRGGRTIIVITHEPDIAARAHRIVRLRDGLIEQVSDTPITVQ